MDVPLFAMLLATGSCNHARMGNEGLHNGGGHFFTFGDAYTSGVRKGGVRILSVETRKRKVASSAQSNPTNKSNPPPTKTKNSVGPKLGSNKRNAIEPQDRKETFFSEAALDQELATAIPRKLNCFFR
jgi:hypothetical protein